MQHSDMIDTDQYTTVGRYEKQQRDLGESINGNWLRGEVAAGRIPSIVVAGNTFVKTGDLEAHWKLYRAREVQKPHSVLSSSGAAVCLEALSQQLARIEEILTKIHNALES